MIKDGYGKWDIVSVIGHKQRVDMESARTLLQKKGLQIAVIVQQERRVLATPRPVAAEDDRLPKVCAIFRNHCSSTLCVRSELVAAAWCGVGCRCGCGSRLVLANYTAVPRSKLRNLYLPSPSPSDYAIVVYT